MMDAVLSRLGHSEVSVSRVVLGCMFSSRLRAPDVERVLHAACDAGITSFDTAPLYGFYESETLVGRALRDRRSRVQILSKAGLRWDDTHGQVLFSFPDDHGVVRSVRKDSRPASLRAEIEGSLQRLGIETIDLLQIHHPDLDTPIADSIHLLQKLQREGKIRALGVSNFAVPELEQAVNAAAANGCIASCQSEYSLLERAVESSVLPVCAAHDVSLLAYSPLAKGALCRGLDWAGQRARRGSRFDTLSVRLPLAYAVQVALARIGRTHGATPAQTALAWLLAQPAVGAVVVGASSVAQAETLASVPSLRLSVNDVRTLGETFARITPFVAFGERLDRTPVVSKLVNKLTRTLDRATALLPARR